MRRKMCKLLPLLCFLLGLTVWCARLDTKAAEEATVYISVERFTVGQGYIVKPTKVTTTEGTPVSELVEKVLKEEGYVPDIETNSSYGWYLAGVENADTGKVRVPVTVLNLDSFTFRSLYPTGVLPASENYAYPELAQFSYQNEGMTSGWFYYANNHDPGYGMAYYEVKDQDVIRIQFTLCMGDMATVPNIDSATRSLTVVKDYLRSVSDSEIQSIYENAIAILSDMDAEKEAVLRLQDILAELSSDLEDGIKTQSYEADLTEIIDLYDQTRAHGLELRIARLPKTITLADGEVVKDTASLYDKLTSAQKNWVDGELKGKLSSAVTVLDELEKKSKSSTQTKSGTSSDSKAKEAALKKKYTPAKVKIKKVKPGKKKVKLTWKKISKATGYQIFMSRKKKTGYKKITTIKKAKTVTFTRKKLKSKKTYYFRIRAYRKVGKTTYYGPYSVVKKAKIK